MIEENTIKLGPFLGVNNFKKETDKVFDQLEGQASYLKEATDVDIDNSGWVHSRLGASEYRSGTNIQGMFNALGRVFIQEDGTLSELSGGSETTLVTGLSTVNTISMADFGDAIFLTDGSKHRVIRDTSVFNWGLTQPTISISEDLSASSSFAEGTYLVQASYSDSFGNEGPVCALSTITISAESGIELDCTLDSDAAYLNIYCSKVNQKETGFLTQVEQGDLPYTIATDPNESDPPITELMTGPHSNIVGITSFQAYLLIWKNNIFWRSEAQEPHLFHPDNRYAFPSNITGIAAIPDGGLWVGTETGLWWLPGGEPPWRGFQKTRVPVLKGSIVLPKWEVPGTNLQDAPIELLAVFATKNGFVAGTDNGFVIALTDGVYHIDTDTYTEAKFTLVDQNNIQQLVVSLT